MDELAQRYFGTITKMIKENKTTKELENEKFKTYETYKRNNKTDKR